MRIYTMCVDQESGRYMAMSVDTADVPYPTAEEFSHTSEEEALGQLIKRLLAERDAPVCIIEVSHIETASRDPGGLRDNAKF